MNQFIKYVGLDTHKDTIAFAVADAAGGKPRFYVEIANTPTALSKLMTDISPNAEVVSYCYEAGAIRPLCGDSGSYSSSCKARLERKC